MIYKHMHTFVYFKGKNSRRRAPSVEQEAKEEPAVKIWEVPGAGSSVVKRGLLQGAATWGLSDSSDGMRNCAAPASKKAFPMALSFTAQITSQPSTSFLKNPSSQVLNKARIPEGLNCILVAADLH